MSVRLCQADDDRKVQREILEKRVAWRRALNVTVLLREERWHHQRADLMMRRLVRDDLKRPANHRKHHIHVVSVFRNSSCESPLFEE